MHAVQWTLGPRTDDICCFPCSRSCALLLYLLKFPGSFTSLSHSPLQRRLKTYFLPPLSTLVFHLLVGVKSVRWTSVLPQLRALLSSCRSSFVQNHSNKVQEFYANNNLTIRCSKIQCMDSRDNARILVEQRPCTCSLSRGRAGTGFPRQHERYPKMGDEKFERKRQELSQLCADRGLIGQRLSLHNSQFSNVTPLHSLAAEQVSLGIMQGFQQKEMLNSMQHTESTEHSFHLDLCGSWLCHYPPFLQQNKKLYILHILPYFPFIAP